MAQLSVAVLGSVRVHRDGVPCAVRGRRQRALLAALAVRHPRAVPVDALVDAVWDDDPPAGARTTLQTYVSRLRGVLGEDAILHDPAGYRFDPATEVDLHEARAALAEGRDHLDRDPEAALATLTAALDRWDGVALAELAHTEWFAPTVAGAQELQDSLLAARAEALVRAGRSVEAVEALEATVHANPFDERAQLLLVRALADAGRATDALRAADRYRARLREETGLEPGPTLAVLESDILSSTDAAPSRAPVTAPVEHATRAHLGQRLSRPTPLVGRDAVLDDLRGLVTRHRLVTVLGPGGVGKTRLVAELLLDPPSGARPVVVDLATAEPATVLGAVATAAGHPGAAAEPDGTRLAQALAADGPALLVLDSCEHVVAEIRPLVRTLLDTDPDITVLATSRTTFALPHEQLVALQPLPTTGDDPPALDLFAAAVARTRPGAEGDLDETVARRLCERLDGLPLALELAASRAAVLGGDELLRELERSPAVLEAPTGSRPSRHTSLRALVGWSYELLDDDARRLLRALAAFRAEFDPSAVEQVGSPLLATPTRQLAQLVDASLVAVGSGPGRFRLLDVIRAFALEELDGSGDEPLIREAHARWVASRVTDAVATCAGPQEHALSPALGEVRADLRAALAWAAEAGDLSVLDELAGAVGGPLLYRPDAEAASTLADLARASYPDGDGRGAALAAAGARAAALAGSLELASDLAAVALDACAPRAADRSASRAHHAQGMVALYQGRFVDAERSFLAAVGAAEDGTDRCDAFGGAALAACFAGDRAAAAQHAADHRAAAEASGSPTALAFAGYIEGERRLAEGDPDGAIDALDGAAEAAWAVQASLVWGLASTVLAATLARQGRHREAADRLPVLLRRWQRTATWPQLWTSLRLIAEVLAALGHDEPAAVLLDAATPELGAPALHGADLAAATRLRDAVHARLSPQQAQLVRARATTLARHQLLELAAGALADATT